MHCFYKISIYAIILTALSMSASRHCCAETTKDTLVSTVHLLPQITVSASPAPPPPGQTLIDELQLKQLPNKGAITDFLKIAPGVQFTEETDSSFQAGEIEPTNISISGGRGYENNFLIDGSSNSNNLDPYALKVDDIDILAATPQEAYINPNLIKSLNIYDHNISARYGHFTGGVVEAETIDPGDELAGEIGYRTTRDNWTTFYIHPDDEEIFKDANQTNQQPHFDKHFFDFIISGPINDDQGLVFSYSINYSKIPLTPFIVEETQTRSSENYYLKHVIDISPNTQIQSSFTYAPYRAKLFINKSINSNFIYSSETYALQSGIKSSNYFGELSLNIAAKNNTDKREAPDHYFSWDPDFGETKDWGNIIGSSRSNEGGYGDLTRSNQSFNINAHFSSHLKKSSFFLNQVSAGFEYDHAQAKYLRPRIVYSYTTPKALAATESCLPDDPACVAGEQYLSKRLVYKKGSARVENDTFSTYIELLKATKHLQLTPGLRVSYDDLMKNLDLAPRFLATLDFFGNGKTKLTFGANRYYGQNLLAAKLREAIQPTYSSTRVDQFAQWSDPVKNTFTIVSKFSTLKTPYSDELSFDIQQKVFTSNLTIGYVQRQNKNQLATELDMTQDADGNRQRTLNNNGYSKYDSYRLNWDKQWAKHALMFNVTYEKITSSNESYTDTLDEEDLEDYVYQDGALKLKTELPRTNFSRPWTANVLYTTDLSHGFSFTNATRYQSRYRILADTKKNIEIDGETYDIYDEIARSSALTFDWKVSWEKELYNSNSLQLTLDIYNVFNQKIEIGTEENEYKLGRQYWAGLTYKF